MAFFCWGALSAAIPLADLRENWLVDAIVAKANGDTDLKSGLKRQAPGVLPAIFLITTFEDLVPWQLRHIVSADNPCGLPGDATANPDLSRRFHVFQGMPVIRSIPCG